MSNPTDFEEILKGLQVPQEAIKNAVLLYTASDRYYHNLDHITDTIAIANILCDQNNSNVVKTALAFHDVIYDPKNKTNELDSALWFIENVKQDWQVYDLIRQTQSHNGLDKLSQIVNDCDLYILGSNWNSYLKYSKNIRREYAHVDDVSYCIGRTNVLKDFLLKNSIYQTQYMYRYFEKKARKNITKEIEKLNEQTFKSW